MIKAVLFLVLAFVLFSAYYYAGPIFAGIAAMVIGWIWFSTWRERRRLEAIPTFQAYIKQHPHLKTDSGVRCRACNSTKMSIVPLDGAGNKGHVCSTCNTVLYRTELKIDI